MIVPMVRNYKMIERFRLLHSGVVVLFFLFLVNLPLTGVCVYPEYGLGDSVNERLVFPDFEDIEIYRGSEYQFEMDDINKRIWYLGLGNYLKNENDNPELDFDVKSYGFSCGIDRRPGRYSFHGFGITANKTEFDSKNDTYGGDTKSLLVNAYTRLTFLKISFELEGGVGFHDNDRFRDSGYGIYFGEFNSNQWMGAGEVTWTQEQGFAKFQVFGRLRYGHLSESGYKEKRVLGSGASRSFGKYDGETISSFLGCRYYWRKEGYLAVLTPSITSGWIHEFEDTTIFSAHEFSSTPVFYRYAGADRPRDRLFIGVGLSASMKKCMDLYLRYNGELAKEYGSHSLILGMNWNF